MGASHACTGGTGGTGGKRNQGVSAALGLKAATLPSVCALGLPALSAALPPGGERAARATLDSFLGGRGRDDRRAMSSPLTATEGCSRLSAHLAFGTISIRCGHQATVAQIAATTCVFQPIVDGISG